MHSLLVMMKSTKLQYLELQGIPSDASMFTLIVNGVQKKPVKGGSNGDSLLVPLLVRLDTEASNTGLGVKTSIELRYFSVQEPLDEEGSINLHTPQVTLPISVVTTGQGRTLTTSLVLMAEVQSRWTSRKVDVPISSLVYLW